MRENKITKLSNTKRQCNKEFCSCPALEHEFQPFEWRKSPVKIKKTLLDMKKEFELSHKAKLTTEQLLVKCSDELNMAKAKVFSLLDQIGLNVSLLESTALRSNALTPSDYLSLMRSQVNEEQAPGYLTRLETLTELQNNWDAGILACESHMTENSRTKLKPQSHQTEKVTQHHERIIRSEIAQSKTDVRTKIDSSSNDQYNNTKGKKSTFRSWLPF
jgi:hypothetical protein